MEYTRDQLEEFSNEELALIAAERGHDVSRRRRVIEDRVREVDPTYGVRSDRAVKIRDTFKVGFDITALSTVMFAVSFGLFVLILAILFVDGHRAAQGIKLFDDSTIIGLGPIGITSYGLASVALIMAFFVISFIHATLRLHDDEQYKFSLALLFDDLLYLSGAGYFASSFARLVSKATGQHIDVSNWFEPRRERPVNTVGRLLYMIIFVIALLSFFGVATDDFGDNPDEPWYISYRNVFHKDVETFHAILGSILQVFVLTLAAHWGMLFITSQVDKIMPGLLDFFSGSAEQNALRERIERQYWMELLLSDQARKNGQ